MSDWECLWSDFIQEELRLKLAKTSSSSDKGSKVHKEEDNLALAGKVKGKKGKGKTENSQKGDNKKTDLNKIKCFHCHTFGHYASNCPNRKKRGSNKEHVVA